MTEHENPNRNDRPQTGSELREEDLSQVSGGASSSSIKLKNSGSISDLITGDVKANFNQKGDDSKGEIALEPSQS